VQDALIRAWKHWDSFTAEPRFGPWLFRIVTNRALDLVRHRHTVQVHEAFVSEQAQDALAQAQLLAAEIRAALTDLPPMQRLVASLFLEHGFTGRWVRPRWWTQRWPRRARAAVRTQSDAP
jgi:RNA polymerase sigma factor (sigma-70 family)